WIDRRDRHARDHHARGHDRADGGDRLLRRQRGPPPRLRAPRDPGQRVPAQGRAGRARAGPHGRRPAAPAAPGGQGPLGHERRRARPRRPERGVRRGPPRRRLGGRGGDAGPPRLPRAGGARRPRGAPPRRGQDAGPAGLAVRPQRAAHPPRLPGPRGDGTVRRLALAAALAALGLAAPAGALSRPAVAIDPGHGGKDSGAKGVLPPGTFTGLTPRFDRDGRTMIYEKDVTLDIALRLNGWLKARGFPTLMTRTKDLAGG